MPRPKSNPALTIATVLANASGQSVEDLLEQPPGPNERSVQDRISELAFVDGAIATLCLSLAQLMDRTPTAATGKELLNALKALAESARVETQEQPKVNALMEAIKAS